MFTACGTIPRSSDNSSMAHLHGASLEAHGKEYACNAGEPVQSLGWKDPVEEKMATHSSILAWRIPRTEEHGRLQSIGSQEAGHDRSD